MHVMLGTVLLATAAVLSAVVSLPPQYFPLTVDTSAFSLNAFNLLSKQRILPLDIARVRWHPHTDMGQVKLSLSVW
ncbi:hypothetical protein CPC08DRAFT_709369 [Agrocybe pediades]|nr:hypothetical protein CPC08DRAFT_709369 [Agrocybe pediades]